MIVFCFFGFNLPTSALSCIFNTMISDIYYDDDDDRSFPRLRYWIRRILLGKSLKEKTYRRYPMIANLQKWMRLFASEFIGTFFLVLFIAGIQLADVYSREILLDDDINLISKGIVGGFVLTGMIYAFGGLSGAHLNPGRSYIDID